MSEIEKAGFDEMVCRWWKMAFGFAVANQISGWLFGAAQVLDDELCDELELLSELLLEMEE